MAVQEWRGPLQRDADGDPQMDVLPGEFNKPNSKISDDAQQIPSRATLARRWPSLRLNRYTGAWRDDASGAKGADVTSLRSYIGEGSR